MKLLFVTFSFLFDNFDPVDNDDMIEILVQSSTPIVAAKSLPQHLLNIFHELQHTTRTTQERTQFLRVWFVVARAFLQQSGVLPSLMAGSSERGRQFLEASNDSLSTAEDAFVFSRVLNLYLHNNRQSYYTYQEIGGFIDAGLSQQQPTILGIFKVAYMVLALVRDHIEPAVVILEEEGHEQLRLMLADIVSVLNVELISFSHERLKTALIIRQERKQQTLQRRQEAQELLLFIKGAVSSIEPLSGLNSVREGQAIARIADILRLYSGKNQPLCELGDLEHEELRKWLLNCTTAVPPRMQAPQEQFNTVSLAEIRIKLLINLARIYFNMGAELSSSLNNVITEYQEYCLRLQPSLPLEMDGDRRVLTILVAHTRVANERLLVTNKQFDFMLKHRALVATLLNEKTQHLSYLLQCLLLVAMDEHRFDQTLLQQLSRFYHTCQYASAACKVLESNNKNPRPAMPALIHAALMELTPMIGNHAVTALIGLCSYHQQALLHGSKLTRLEQINELMLPEMPTTYLTLLLKLDDNVTHLLHREISVLMQQYEIIVKAMKYLGQPRADQVLGIDCITTIKYLLSEVTFALQVLFRDNLQEPKDMYVLPEFIRSVKYCRLLLATDETFKTLIRVELYDLILSLLNRMASFNTQAKPAGYTTAYLSLQQVMIEIYAVIDPVEWIRSLLLKKSPNENWIAYFILASLCKRFMIEQEDQYTIAECLTTLNLIAPLLNQCFTGAAIVASDMLANSEIMSALYILLRVLNELRPNVMAMTPELIEIYHSNCSVALDDELQETIAGIKLGDVVVLSAVQIKGALSLHEQEEIYKNIILPLRTKLQGASNKRTLGCNTKEGGPHPGLTMSESVVGEALSSGERTAFMAFTATKEAPQLSRPEAPSLLASAGMHTMGLFRSITATISRSSDPAAAADTSQTLKPPGVSSTLQMGDGDL